MNSLLDWSRRIAHRFARQLISAEPISQISTAASISVDESKAVIDAIEKKGWWQGSVLSGESLAAFCSDLPRTEWWIIASQTCNLYNPSLTKVPVIELVAACRIDECNGAKVKGNDPRILHVEATSDVEKVALEIDILTRCWIPRVILAKLPASDLRLRDTSAQVSQMEQSAKWNDNFSGWMGRSYTRVALPDEFNRALRASRIEKTIESKLAKRDKDLYGVYFAIDSGAEEAWNGALGEMPSPYLLGITLVVEEHADADLIRLDFVKNVFEAEIADPENEDRKTTRANLARRNGIRIISEDVIAKSITEITLYELKGLVRFSMIDHLSDSSMAVAV